MSAFLVGVILVGGVYGAGLLVADTLATLLRVLEWVRCRRDARADALAPPVLEAYVSEWDR